MFILTFILTWHMASVIKRKKSQFWIACYTDRTGRQLKRSTKTVDRNLALQMAVDFERVEKQAGATLVTTAQFQKVLQDVSVRITGDSIIAPSSEAYLNDWLENGERPEYSRDPGAIQEYRHHLFEGVGQESDPAGVFCHAKGCGGFSDGTIEERRGMSHA